MLDELLESLNSDDGVTREDALRDAGALPSRAKLQLYIMAVDRYRRQSGRYAFKAGLYVVLFLLWLLAVQFSPEPWHLVLFWCMLATFLANAVLNKSPDNGRRQLVLLGQNLEDVRFVLPLLRLLYEPTHDKPDPVLADVLKRLLPRLRYRDAKHWKTEDRSLLLLPLQNRGDADLTLCALRALEQVGDENAIPIVERLASMFMSDARIADAARECLPYLRTNVEQSRQSQTLLRATQPVFDLGVSLLRPAHQDFDDESVNELVLPVSHHAADAAE